MGSSKKVLEKGLRVLVCGDRNWWDSILIKHELLKIIKKHKKVTVIDGAANGADSIGHNVALLLKLSCQRFPANWQKFGAAAGPIRNREMLKKGKPDLVLAFHDDLENSKGTKDMVAIAEKAGVEVRKIKHQN